MKICSGYTGRIGEELAAKYLIANGFLVIERNFKEERIGEIDIIAAKDGILHFIEVKTSKNTNIFDENHTVKHFNKDKRERMIRTMERYCYSHNVTHKTRCADLVIVTIYPNTGKAEIMFEENVYMSTI